MPRFIDISGGAPISAAADVRDAISAYPAVSLKDYGAVGDGVTDDTDAVNAAFASGESIYIPPGDYRCANFISGPENNTSPVRIVGAPGARIFTDAEWRMLFLKDCTDVTFEGITFETTYDDSLALHSAGMVQSNQKDLTRLKFINCTFKAEATAVNGILLIVTGMSDEIHVDDVLIEGCDFFMPRMAWEFLDQTGHPTLASNVVRMRNVRVENCNHYDCGSVHGLASSFCGHIEGAAAINNRYYDGGDGIALEFAQHHVSPKAIGNTFIGLHDDAHPIACTTLYTTEYNTGMTIAYNKTIGRCGYALRAWQLKDARFYGNMIYSTDYALDMRYCKDVRVSGDLYDGMGTVAVRLEGDAARPMTGTEFRDCVIRNSNPTTNYGVVRFASAYTYDNRVYDSKLTNMPAATMKAGDNDSGAYNNQLHRCIINSDAAPTLYRPYRVRTLSDSDVTLSLSDADVEFIRFSGTLTSTRTVTFPLQKRAIYIHNSTAQSLQIAEPGGYYQTLNKSCGSWFGFDGATIYRQEALQTSAYSPSNVSTDRSYDANSTTVDELADVLGTLIDDLQSRNVIG